METGARPRVRVRLLGTGGAANECRHQACLLVEGAGGDGGPLLLDTGNGMDVVRRLAELGRDPREVRDVFVSHQHADHVGGLDSLLLCSAVRDYHQHGGPPPRQTRVYAEPRILDAIDRLHEATAATPILTLFGDRLSWVQLRDGVAIELSSAARLLPFLVDHEPRGGGALGCLVELGGRKIVYSGDTRPCARLVEVARGADVLFHESGGLDERAELIHRQGHSTAGDAGRAARAAGVKRLVLTHLPYDDWAKPMLAEAQAAFGGPVELARDLATVEI